MQKRRVSHVGKTCGTHLKVLLHPLAFAEVILAAALAVTPTVVPSMRRRISAFQLLLHAPVLCSFHHTVGNVRRAQPNVAAPLGPAAQLVSMRRAVRADERVITSSSLDASLKGRAVVPTTWDVNRRRAVRRGS